MMKRILELLNQAIKRKEELLSIPSRIDAFSPIQETLDLIVESLKNLINLCLFRPTLTEEFNLLNSARETMIDQIQILLAKPFENFIADIPELKQFNDQINTDLVTHKSNMRGSNQLDNYPDILQAIEYLKLETEKILTHRVSMTHAFNKELKNNLGTAKGLASLGFHNMWTDEEDIGALTKFRQILNFENEHLTAGELRRLTSFNPLQDTDSSLDDMINYIIRCQRGDNMFLESLSQTSKQTALP